MKQTLYATLFVLLYLLGSILFVPTEVKVSRLNFDNENQAIWFFNKYGNSVGHMVFEGKKIKSIYQNQGIHQDRGITFKDFILGTYSNYSNQGRR